MVVPDSRLSFLRRVNVAAAVASNHSPEIVVRAILHLWKRARFSRLASRRTPKKIQAAIQAPAVEALAHWLASRPFEESAYWLATAYAFWVGDSVRTERSLFFTPPVLAARVVNSLQQHGASLVEHKWHDPACGGAAFLVPIAVRMNAAMQSLRLRPAERLRRIAANLSGNDLDLTLLELSRSFLEMALYEAITECRYSPDFQLLHGDGLISDHLELSKPDVIACNPPYRKLKTFEANRYRAKHGDISEGQPNIYGLFINRTLQLVRNRGLVGLLTPTSFLSGQSFSKLRTKLLCHAETLEIDVLANHVSIFVYAEQETAITILRTRAKPSKTVEDRTSVNVLSASGKFENVGNFLLPNSGRPWPIPRSASDACLIHDAEIAAARLRHYGYVPKVGHLVGYRDRRPRFKKPRKTRKGQIVIPLIWATDITPNGKFKHARDSRYVRVGSYVQVEGLTAPGVITKPAVILQRLTSSSQRSRLVAAVVPADWVQKHGGFICENHVIVLQPCGEDALPPKQMARLLNTMTIDRVFRSISAANNVAISELNALALPDRKVLDEQLRTESDIEVAIRTAYRRTTLS